MRPPSSQSVLNKLTASPIFSCSTPTSTFFRITFDRTLFVFIQISSLKAKFFFHLKVLRCISTSYVAPLRSPSLFCIQLFSSSFSHMLHPDGFLFQALPTLPNWIAFTEWQVAPSSAASCSPLSCFLSPTRPYFFCEPSQLISLCYLMSGVFHGPNLHSHFRFD